MSIDELLNIRRRGRKESRPLWQRFLRVIEDAVGSRE